MSQSFYEELTAAMRNKTEARGLGDISRKLGPRIELLRSVPDDAPCFSPQRSTETQLALAVLAGDHGAAAALADEVVSKYAGRPRKGPETLGYFQTMGDYLRAVVNSTVYQHRMPRQFVDRGEREFKGLQTSTVDFPVLRSLLHSTYDVLIRKYSYTDFNKMYVFLSYEAHRAFMCSDEIRELSNRWGYFSSAGIANYYGCTVRSADFVLDSTPDIVIGYMLRNNTEQHNAPVYPLIIQDSFR